MTKAIKKQEKLEKIVDFSTLRKMPERLPFHWLYVFFFGLALISSLWQHGHPALTVTVLALIIPLGIMAYVPYRKMSSELRFYMQIAIIVASGIWFAVRMKQHISIDKILIESVCICGLCFIFAQRSADYDYLFLISIFLLLYGALLPRAIFILVFIIAFILAAFLLYSTRIKSLSGQGNIKNPARIFRRNWPQFLIHLCLAFSIFWYMFALFPDGTTEQEGLFEVSFNTENDSLLPPEIRNWFGFNKIKKSDKGKLIVKGSKPMVLGQQGPKVAVKNNKSNSSAGDGGSGTPSDEMIFRVKSPVKLYWLCQLYDQYDGVSWTVSPQTLNFDSRRTDKLDNQVIHHTVEQQFIIEKWLTPKLYSAYRAVSFDLYKQNQRLIRIKTNAYGAELEEKQYPALPFNYSVSSILYIPNLDYSNAKDTPAVSYWVDRIPKKEFLKLPRANISQRLRLLVKRLTMNVADPFKKAIILRNYLRENYKYQQFSAKPPPDKEAVDYFIFELREGHCEYFASSLAVLARLCGLPSRVATGFSPGNYNALSKYFEVHAYHAHAWTQIFIEGMGWLTFDATPPGNIVSKTTPFGIGSLRDPFGDSWRVMPPELTPETLELVRKGHFDQMERDKNGTKYTTTEKLLMEASLTPERAKDILKDWLDRALPNVKGAGFEKLTTLYLQIKDGLKKMFANIIAHFQNAINSVTRNWKFFLPLLAIIIAVFMEINIIRAYLQKKRSLKNCRQRYLEAKKAIDYNPAETVRLCYLTVRQLLTLADFPRRHNQELLAYGTSLELIDHQLCKDTVII
ncbi:MAG: transglutaminase domain-containing protein, partial [Victivallaceae bacterium]